MIRMVLAVVFTASFLSLGLISQGSCHLESVFLVHPDHGAPFPEQLSGQWVLDNGGKEVQRLRFYEDGRFAYFGGKEWTAGSYFILRSDERQKGVLRLEYYLDGNLHFEEVRCEVHFEAHSETHGHADESGESDEAHSHEFLRVEVLGGAEQALKMSGEFLHVH